MICHFNVLLCVKKLKIELFSGIIFFGKALSL